MVLVAIAVSIVHYVDNYAAYEAYPQSETLPNPSAGLVAVAWFVFTGFGVAALAFLRRGSSIAAAICLAVYSGSGLIGLGHYAVGGTGDFPWWRHAHIVADVILGVAVLACAVYLVLRSRDESVGATRSEGGRLLGKPRGPAGDVPSEDAGGHGRLSPQSKRSGK